MGEPRYTKIGRRIREIRLRSPYKLQNDLARRISIEKGDLSLMESGHRLVTEETLELIIAVTGATESERQELKKLRIEAVATDAKLSVRASTIDWPLVMDLIENEISCFHRKCNVHITKNQTRSLLTRLEMILRGKLED